MTIKERIKNLCLKNGISAKELELELKLGKGYISKIGKDGMKPNMAKASAIAEYFNVSIEYLMTGKEPDVNIDYVYSNGNDQIIIEVMKNMNDDKFKRMLQYYLSLSKMDREFVDKTIEYVANKNKGEV